MYDPRWFLGCSLQRAPQLSASKALTVNQSRSRDVRCLSRTASPVPPARKNEPSRIAALCTFDDANLLSVESRIATHDPVTLTPPQ